MPHVPGLRSSYAKVGRLVYFGRMLDKIRLHAAGKLPAEYVANLGDTKPGVFDTRCCRFLGVSHADLTARTLQGGGDAEILAWAHTRGTPRTDEDCEIWNAFMAKRGWRDDRSTPLRQRIADFGLTGKPIETWFDLNDYDEGRDPVAARAWELRPPLVVLIMGVAGSGKTTLGSKLAGDLGWNFRDADDFHPPANIAKMSAGLPLTDEDRAPWLAAIRAHIDTCLSRGESAVVTCSALKERYRQAVIPDPARVKLVYLHGDFALLFQRLNQRQGHFMKESMLRSQFEALEPPRDALTLDAAQPPEKLVAGIRASFGL
ncbi:MAG TPA: gluconokinase, GntK/IdnK-type [Opitutaceae bacterium]|nr:gluconokinase, GntK/IdnK-type [Opitutaceae bacterium]